MSSQYHLTPKILSPREMSYTSEHGLPFKTQNLFE